MFIIEGPCNFIDDIDYKFVDGGALPETKLDKANNLIFDGNDYDQGIFPPFRKITQVNVSVKNFGKKGIVFFKILLYILTKYHYYYLYPCVYH